MQVYRIEDPGGIGPYRSELTASMVFRNARSQPTPFEEEWFTNGTEWWEKWYTAVDRVFGNEEGFVFGFKTMEQFRNWFDGEDVQRLLEWGFTVRRYEATRYVEMEHQVAFLPWKWRVA